MKSRKLSIGLGQTVSHSYLSAEDAYELMSLDKLFSITITIPSE